MYIYICRKLQTSYIYICYINFQIHKLCSISCTYSEFPVENISAYTIAIYNNNNMCMNISPNTATHHVEKLEQNIPPSI